MKNEDLLHQHDSTSDSTDSDEIDYDVDPLECEQLMKTLNLFKERNEETQNLKETIDDDSDQNEADDQNE
jgi:hypothetical protein